MITTNSKKYCNRTHYLKFIINEEWSIRYHFKFEFKKYTKYEHQYILKSHFTKDYILLSKEEAEEYIEKYVSSFVEIFGFSYQGEFKKLIISKENIELITEH